MSKEPNIEKKGIVEKKSENEETPQVVDDVVPKLNKDSVISKPRI